MITIGDALGRSARPRIGVGISLPPGSEPEPQPIIYSAWQRGIVALDAPEDIPENSAITATDMEVYRADALIRSPGALLFEDVTPRNAQWLFEHAAIDYAAELVIIDPPWLGYMDVPPFTFVNLALAATGQFGWNIVNVAGTLLFSNGLDATYTREPGAAIVTDISADIIAQTFATSFGRTFAGAYVDPIAGLQALGIKWNANNGLIDDWAGAGSGAEILLSNDPKADRIVALLPLGFDILVVLTRKAIWFGYPTQQANRPANFRLRFPGLGCVSARTIANTPFGALYLTDDGVCQVDVSKAQIVSTEINPLLLPIDRLNLDKYKAIYIASNQLYVLQTPTGVFVYEFPKGDIPGRWFFRSILPDSLASFTDQAGSLYWSNIVGTWDDQTLTWNEMVVGEQNAESSLLYVKGSRILRSTEDALDYDGTAQNPSWTTPQRLASVTDQVTTIGFEIEYSTDGAATFQFGVSDSNGDITQVSTVALADTANVRKTGFFPFMYTGKGSTVRFRILTGIPRIYRVTQKVMPAGPTLQALSAA